MNKIAKYSAIMYCNELLEENIEYIIGMLEKGVVFHLFLNGSFKEELELNEYESDFFNIAKENYLLYVYEIEEELYSENVLVAVDNEVLNKNIYSEIKEEKISEFNYQQHEIITADEKGNYIVVSGAGTGKTTTMINRLMYLRKKVNGFTFDKVALITFTNKASREMKERLIKVLDRYYKVTKDPYYLDLMDEAARCNITTIHGFAKKLINKYGKAIDINRDIAVKSFRFQRKKAITYGLNYVYKNHDELYQLIKYYPLYDIEAKLLTFWDKLDNYSIDVNSKNYTVDFGTDEKDFSKIVELVIEKAQEYVEENKDYEFEISDLMKKLAYKELFYEAKGEYDLIMVDEFQDSDNIQIDFVVNFCNITGSKLLVVGDEKQSIYRFRGAEHTSFHRLKKAFGSKALNINEFNMVRNYRTDAKLLNEINDIFVALNEKVDRFSYKEEDQIYSLINKDAESEIEYVTINELDENIGDFYHDILQNKGEDEYVAVLLRSNNDIKAFKEFCDRKSIPCRVDIAGGFYRHEAVRDFYCMIKGLISSTSNNAKYSLINTPYINSEVNKELILLNTVEENTLYFNKVLEENNWNYYRRLIGDVNILDLITTIYSELNPVKNYYKDQLVKAKRNSGNYKNIAYVKTLEYKLNLEHLICILREKFSDKVSSIYSVEEFLKIKIATDDTIDIRKPEDIYNKQFIQCSTVHKAKGLEYDYVIMPKLTNKFITGKAVDVIIRSNEDNIKIGFKVFLGDSEYKNSNYSSFIKDEKAEIIGEEVRLLYVAMTRCKKKLILNAGGIAATEGMNNWKNLIGGIKSYV